MGILNFFMNTAVFREGMVPQEEWMLFLRLVFFFKDPSLSSPSASWWIYFIVFILDFSFCFYSPSGLWFIEPYVTILEYTTVDIS